MEKKNLKKVLIAMIIALVVMGRSLVTYVFQIPNGFAPGGVSGIATIIYNIVNIVPHAKIMEDIFNPSIVIFVINIPLLVLAFIYVNKKYAFATMIAVLIYAGSIKIFELVSVPQFTATSGATGTDFNTFVSSAGLKILSALIGGVLDGFCYIGSAITAYGMGKVADNYGWNKVFYFFIAVCCVMMLLSIAYFVVSKLIEKTKNKQQN